MVSLESDLFQHVGRLKMLCLVVYGRLQYVDVSHIDLATNEQFDIFFIHFVFVVYFCLPVRFSFCSFFFF